MRFASAGSLGLLWLAACGGSGFSDTERSRVTASVDSATRAFEAAQRARDADLTAAFFAPEFYMYNDGQRADYESVVTGMRQSLPQFRHVEPGFQDVNVMALAPDAAVASLTFHDSIITATGELLQLRGPTTLVWQQRGPDWRIVYAHSDHYPDTTR
jgi:ketosteroid isomerase-like protein